MYYIDKLAYRYLIASICVLFAFSTGPAKGQNVALKTNILYDATATVNAGVEFSVAPKWTMDISGNYNGWNFSDNRKWKHSPRERRNARPEYGKRSRE